jgi:aromatic-L-amino-acid decarboxylase
LRKALPLTAPEHSEDFSQIFADIDRLIVPGITHWQSPNFFAYFPANTSGPSILGELLAAGLGVQGMLWATSPACTELETHMLDWLADLCALPDQFKSAESGGGVLLDSASSATLCALIAAREKATQGNSNHSGLNQSLHSQGQASSIPNRLSNLIAYTSDQAHSSVLKAVRIAGIGETQLRMIPSDSEHRMNVSDLLRAITRDLKEGYLPFFCTATIGTTSSMAVDPIKEIAAICNAHSIWLHVDAAMAGSAALCPEYRHYFTGLNHAKSYTFNPHKWLLTNFDCNCFFVSDRQALTSALSILPEYLRTSASESGEVIDYRDWQIPLGRRFRALKLWFVLRYYGAEKLREYLRGHMQMAQHFAGLIENSDEFILAAPVTFSLVCFRHKAGDTFNEKLLNTLNLSGKLYLSHTRLEGHYTLRLSIGAAHTNSKHIDAAWSVIMETSQSNNRFLT